MRFFFSFFIVLTTTFLSGQTYKGTIGNYPVYLHFQGNGSVDGAYCYASQLRTIPVEGSITKGGVELHVTDGDGVLSEVFKLTKKETTLEGTWIGNEKTLPVELTLVTEADVPNGRFTGNPYLNALELIDYERLLLQHFRLSALDSSLTVGGVTLRFFEETNTKVIWFRVDSGMPADQMKQLNQFLEIRQLQDYIAVLSCDSRYVVNSTLDHSFEDFLYQQGFFCWVTNSYEVCNSFREEFYKTGYNFDLTNGVLLEPEKLLTEDANAISPLKSVYNESMTNWQAMIIAYFTRIEPKEMLPPADYDQESEEELPYSENCNYVYPGNWDISNGVIFTENGLRFLLDYYGVKAYCSNPEWAIIPYEELDHYLDDAILKRLYKIKPIKQKRE